MPTGKLVTANYCMFGGIFVEASRLEQDRTRTSFDATGKKPTSGGSVPNGTTNTFCYDVLFGKLSTLVANMFVFVVRVQVWMGHTTPDMDIELTSESQEDCYPLLSYGDEVMSQDSVVAESTRTLIWRAYLTKTITTEPLLVGPSRNFLSLNYRGQMLTTVTHCHVCSVLQQDGCDVPSWLGRTGDGELCSEALGWALGLVSISLVLSWLLGAAGLSLAWLLLLLVLVVALWRAHFSRLLDAAIHCERLRVRRRRALSIDETAEWVNFLVNRWWVFSSLTLFSIVKERLEPILNEAKPSIVVSPIHRHSVPYIHHSVPYVHRHSVPSTLSPIHHHSVPYTPPQCPLYTTTVSPIYTTVSPMYIVIVSPLHHHIVSSTPSQCPLYTDIIELKYVLFLERLELHQFTLGDQTPDIRSVRVFDVSEGKRLRTLGIPPKGLAQSSRHQLGIEADVCLNSDDFRMLLHARLFGRGMGMDLDIAVEKLNVSGRVYATLTLNMDAPFPHITHLSLTFVDKPEVWFSVRILKAVQMMEIPLLKTWIHSLVMDALVLALVDPGQLDLNLTLAESPPRKQESGNTVVQGVLTVTLSTDHTSGEDVRWLTVSLGGEQRHRTSPLSPRWQDSPSFLVRSLTGDRLLVKLKSKRLVSSVTLTQYDIPLAGYGLDTTRVVETVLYKKISLTSIPRISVRLEYTPLPLAPLDTDMSAEDMSAGTGHVSRNRSVILEYTSLPLAPLDTDMSAEDMSTGTGQLDYRQCTRLLPVKDLVSRQRMGLWVSGVVFAYIHGAEGLMSGEQGDCNPYCMLFKKGTKVKTTHYLRGTSSPQWESQVQFLVRDYTKVALSFVVCSWSPNRMSDARLLGLASFNMALGEIRVVRRVLPLNGSGHANVTVSLVFHPVQSVSQSEPTPCQEESKEDDTCRFPREKRNSNSWVQQAKQLLNNKEQDACISSLLSAGQGLMEVTLLRAHDLVSKDMNGFSDPYCELKVGDERKYKSSVKKKTLNPCWDESAIMGLPCNGGLLEVVLWDHDTFGTNDFLGSVSLSTEDIKRCSKLDLPQRWALQGVKTGVVELRIKVIAEEPQAPSSSNSMAPYKPAVNNTEADVGTKKPAGRESPLLCNKDNSPTCSDTSSPKLPRLIVLQSQPSLCNKDNSPTCSDTSSPKLPRLIVSPHTSSPDEPFNKSPEYSSFRLMKQKCMRHGCCMWRKVRMWSSSLHAL
uniref:C2 domain-containing protein n=1 Tax=Timema bartmani TaxID=61472 RepID=A0A7R9F083_9NEOP|nr:unnamed protein product [Timema bartmani]